MSPSVPYAWIGVVVALLLALAGIAGGFGAFCFALVLGVIGYLVGAATGFATGDFGLFCLAVLGCAILLSASYALVRRWLGWEPLKVDDLFEVVRLLSPH